MLIAQRLANGGAGQRQQVLYAAEQYGGQVTVGRFVVADVEDQAEGIVKRSRAGGCPDADIKVGEKRPGSGPGGGLRRADRQLQLVVDKAGALLALVQIPFISETGKTGGI